MSLAKTYKDVKRLEQVVNTLFKYELGFILDKLKLKSFLPMSSRTKQEKFAYNASMPKCLRMAMEDLGATFIKLGQLLSLRPDLIPKEYCDEFSRLQDNVKPVPFREIKQVIESEFKKPINEIFSSFEETPIASASIGQVHRARLKSNEIVAVKIQRPGIKELFDADIDILYHLAALIEHHLPNMKEIRPTEIVKEFEKYTKNELDYTAEASNIDIFYNNFKNSKKVKIPKVYFDYTTRKVLTMEFIHGKKIDSDAKFIALKSSKNEVIKNVVSCFIEQVIDHGVFHADPHPGNIFLLGSNKIALLDFGIVGKITPDLKDHMESMFIALVKPDKDLLAESLIDLGFIEASVSTADLKKDISEHLGRYYSSSLKEINTSEVIYDVLAVVRKYNVKLPINFVLLLKAIITIEGFGKELNPNFVFTKETKPIVDKLIKKRSGLNYLISSWKARLLKSSMDASKLPEEARLTLKSIRDGNIMIQVSDPNISKFAYEVDKSSNRITFGLLIAGLVIAASIISLANVPPYYNQIPILTIVLLIMAMMFVLLLAISILKERGEKKR